jgi:uncharacterized protein (DUF1697 family)
MKLITKVTNADQTVKRTRTQSATKTTNKVPAVSQEMNELAVQFYSENTKANAHKRVADAARDGLYKAMKAENVSSFRTVFQSEMGPVAIEAKVKAATRKVIDIETLAKIVSPETFRKVVSASQKAVTEIAGSDIAVRCLIEQTGEENVSVSVAK